MAGARRGPLPVPREDQVVTLDERPRTTLQARPPRTPPGLSRSSQALWRKFWATDVASQVEASDLPALRRWIRYVDKWEQLWSEIQDGHMERSPLDGEPYKLPGHLAFGSQGQLVEHPSMRMLLKLEKEIRAVEDRFGFSPMARFSLGWQKAEAGKSLADLGAAVARAVAGQ